MTAIEFFDGNPVKNIISSLVSVPDKIIFVGDGNPMRKFGAVFEKFLNNRNLNIEVCYKSVKRNSLDDIVTALTDIVGGEEECLFDLTGGDELTLVAMGIVFNRFNGKKKLQMQRLNLNNGVVIDCDNDGRVITGGSGRLSIEELIAIHGGAVRHYEREHNKSFSWNLTGEFKKEVNILWDICRTNPGLWNKNITTLGELDAFSCQPDSNRVSVDLLSVEEKMKNSGKDFSFVPGFMKTLERLGVINNLNISGATASYNFKNEQLRKCLTKAGTILELKVLVTAADIKNPDGSDYFTDFMTGVYIDWDGEFHKISEDVKDTENEIDVILMKGTLPVFISCKNGNIGTDELYKLDTVTARFGGIEAKKVLIASYIGKSEKSLMHFRQRSEDMNIKLIESVHLMEDADFIKMIKNLVN